METTFVGKVLELRERNGYHDSDFFATVWDDEQKKPREIEYATTRGWTYPNGADIDATPEVKAAYAAYSEERRKKEIAAYEAERAKMPALGDKIRVIAGRKIPKGTEAEVVWVGEDSFACRRLDRYKSPYSYMLPWRYNAERYRIGVRLLDGTRVFTAAKNIEIISREIK
jgi:hypothetical protein